MQAVAQQLLETAFRLASRVKRRGGGEHGVVQVDKADMPVALRP
jgi:hypothetical protein